MTYKTFSFKTCLYPIQFELSESIAKEGEQCRWTSSYCKQKEEGKKTCMSSKEMKYCEEGFKCTVDPNDTSTGFCRKNGTSFSNKINSESTLFDIMI